MKNNTLYLADSASEKGKEIRDKALDRDGNKCVKCSTTTNIHVYHLTCDKVGEEELTDLITLCEKCREGVHGRIFSNYYEHTNLNYKDSDEHISTALYKCKDK
jgi:5-methylcytosine-specific restriction endonuclease McrA